MHMTDLLKPKKNEVISANISKTKTCAFFAMVPRCST